MNKIIQNYLIAHQALGLELRDTSNTKGYSNEEIDRLCAINSLIWSAHESLRDTAAASLAADVANASESMLSEPTLPLRFTNIAYIPESIPDCLTPEQYAQQAHVPGHLDPNPTDYVMAFLVEAQDPEAMVTSWFAKKKAAAEHDYRAAVSAAEQNYKARCEELAKGYVLERGRRGGLFIHFATGQTVELGTAELSEALQVVLTNHGK